VELRNAVYFAVCVRSVLTYFPILGLNQTSGGNGMAGLLEFGFRTLRMPNTLTKRAIVVSGVVTEILTATGQIYLRLILCLWDRASSL